MMPHQNDKPIVILTGCSGLLGTAVLNDLREAYQVVGFDRDGQPQPPREVECVCVDLTDQHSVDLGCDRVAYAYGKHIAAVVHLAAYYSFSGEDSPLYEEVTVQGTARLMSALQEKGFEVERFIFSSTMLVHGPTEPGRPITEDDPLEASWPYPASKIRTEQKIQELRNGYPTCNLRIAGVYTEWAEAPTLAHHVKRIHEKDFESYVFPGDVTHGQSFVHLKDAVSAIRQAVHRRNQLPEEVSILIGEPTTYSFEQLQDRLGELLHGKDWPTVRVPQSVAKAGAWVQQKAGAALPGLEEPFIKPWMVPHADDHYELDISRARELLGWEPRHRLIDDLADIVAKLREDPDAWYAHNGLKA